MFIDGTSSAVGLGLDTTSSSGEMGKWSLDVKLKRRGHMLLALMPNPSASHWPGGVASYGQTPVDNFTEGQLRAGRDLVLDLLATYQVPTRNAMGHNEVIRSITQGFPEACPVFSMERFRAMVTERLVAGIDVEVVENWGADMADDDETEGLACTHTVISGDTLWGIANRYGTTIAEIRAANPSISGDLIHPGDVIRV